MVGMISSVETIILLIVSQGQRSRGVYSNQPRFAV